MLCVKDRADKHSFLRRWKYLRPHAFVATDMFLVPVIKNHEAYVRSRGSLVKA